MEQKKCKICGRLLPIENFYKHPSMHDGHLNTCKDCVKQRVSEKYYKNCENEDYVEKERARGREKYRRLYAEKHIKSRHSQNKNTRRFLKTRGIDCDGLEVHHWDYNQRNDVFLLSPKAHKKVHRQFTFDAQTQKFTYKGDVLETKDQHRQAIKEILDGDDYTMREFSLS